MFLEIFYILLFTIVKDPEILRRNELYCAKEFCTVEINPAAVEQLHLPDDYQFGQCLLPKKYLTTTTGRLWNFPCYPDDVWTVTFPKSGTTWIMNIVWQLQNNLNFSANYLKAEYKWVDIDMFTEINDENKNNLAYRVYASEAKKLLKTNFPDAPPRLLKSHLPAHLLPKDIWTVKSKVIYVYRNVKDVAISMYHMLQVSWLYQYNGTMEDLFDAFLNDHIFYGPYHDHINSFQQLKSLDHVLLVKYEDMLANPFEGVKNISEFLNYSYTDEQLESLTEHVSFQNMAKASKKPFFLPDRSHFYRKGTSGTYREEMSPEYIQKFDEWEQRHSQMARLL